MKDKLCFALDVSSKKKALYFVEMLKPHVGFFKVGSELFTAEGPKLVKTIIKSGSKVFLDLKLHDIPTTVANVSRVITRLGVSMFNVHAAGGSEMMQSALAAAEDEAAKLGIECPKVLGVTILTSMSYRILKDELNCVLNLKDQVLHYAKEIDNAGLDGIICSPREVESVRAKCDESLLLVTPGIRPKWSLLGQQLKDDQIRASGPAEAIRNGADILVVGRPIRDAIRPVICVKSILNEIEKACNE